MIRQLAKTLPYSDVPWDDFERLLKAIAQREGWDHVDIYGDPGQKQFGIDIVGELPGGDFGAIQSKRYQTFDESDFVKAIEAFDPDKLPLKPVARLIIATTVHTNRRQILDTKSALQADVEVKLEFWDGSDLDERLRKHPDVVQQFFGSQAMKDFCGELPRVVAPAAPEAARIAEIVARGPGNLPEVATLVDEAASVAGVDPSRAASLYADAQAILRKDGFDAHASTWDQDRARALLAAGRERQAVGLLAESYWTALDIGEPNTAQVVTHRLEQLVKDLAADSPEHDFCLRVLRILQHAEAVQSAPIGFVERLLHRVDLVALLDGFEGDAFVTRLVGQLTVLAARTSLSQPRDSWAADNLDILRRVRHVIGEANLSSGTDVPLTVLLDIEIADAAGDWDRLLVEVRRREHSRPAMALIAARAGLAQVLSGEFELAEERWRDAIEFACLSGANLDASEWVYSSRNANQARSGPIFFAQQWTYQTVAHGLAQLGGGQLQPAIRRSAEAAARSRLEEKVRSAAIRGRDYVRRSYSAGSWRQHSHALGLLAGAYAESGEYSAAAACLIEGAQGDRVTKLTGEVGDRWLDVAAYFAHPSPAVRRVAYLLIAKQADLVPDEEIDGIAAAAIADVVDDAMDVSGSTWISALRVLAGLSTRLGHVRSADLVARLEPLILRDEGTYRYSDEAHIQLLSGIALVDPDLRITCITQLVQFATSGGAAHYVRRFSVGLLRDHKDVSIPLLQARMNEGDSDAVRLLAVLDGDVDASAVEAARQRLLASPQHHPGMRTFGTGTVNDAILVAGLPADDRRALVAANIRHAADDPDKWHSQDYLWAATELATGLGPAGDLFEASMSLARSTPPPGDDPFMTDHPLSMVRMTGFENDYRPAAAALGAMLASSDGERAAARDVCLTLLAEQATPARHLAYAIYSAFGDQIGDLLLMLASQEADDYRALAAEAWVMTGGAEAYVGRRLAADPSSKVRRFLAHYLNQALAHREWTANEQLVVERLRTDPLYTIRRLLLPAADAGSTTQVTDLEKRI